MVIQTQLLFQQTQVSSAGPLPMFNPRELDERSKSQVRLTSRKKARLVREMTKRTTERKRRTTPPQPALSGSTSVPLYAIHSLEDEEEPIGHSARAEAQRPANLNELCGLHAQESALANPYSYLSRDSLNSNARVLVTGIPNPIGFHLALALKERCGVKSIIGIDPMFPNTVQNRLDLLEQMKILNTNIPQLVQPITLPMTGLDPRLKKRDPLSFITLLNSTGELNLLSSQPTHIVHLASYEPDMYITESLNKEWRNNYSPYVTADRNPPMYRLQSSAASMEQILASIATADTSERPHFTYGPVVQHEQEPTDRFYTCSKQADDILVDTYHSMSGTFAIGLRLPNAVYGPWARPGNVVYDLAQSLIAYWNSSAPDQEIPSANVTESRHLDLLYVDDVVDAIIAAMQFRSESSSPVILDVTSGSTMSLPSLENMVKSLRKLGTNDVSLDLLQEASPLALSIQQYIHSMEAPNDFAQRVVENHCLAS
jgi:nucleoside-diphosphate-sugar epimerase